MIFCSRNEDGTPASVLVQERRKQVTRRLKMVETGKIVAVQPGRGKHAVCHVRVKSCVRHSDWVEDVMRRHQDDPNSIIEALEEEARLEGFLSWLGVVSWFDGHKVDISQTWRIEFELVKEDML